MWKKTSWYTTTVGIGQLNVQFYDGDNIILTILIFLALESFITLRLLDPQHEKKHENLGIFDKFWSKSLNFIKIRF